MQSGQAKLDGWALEFVPSEGQQADPLMGWAGSGDTRRQLRLHFATLEQAKAYAAQNALDATVIATPPRRIKLQAYADNFR